MPAFHLLLVRPVHTCAVSVPADNAAVRTSEAVYPELGDETDVEFTDIKALDIFAHKVYDIAVTYAAPSCIGDEQVVGAVLC